MHISSLILPAVLASTAIASPTQPEKRATPKVYLAGDSTMALGGGGSGTQGSQSLQQALTVDRCRTDSTS